MSDTASATVEAAPLYPDERIHALDILRGLALFGMILVHFHQRTRIEVTGLEDLIGWGVCPIYLRRLAALACFGMIAEVGCRESTGRSSMV